MAKRVTAVGWRILPSIRLSRDTDVTNSPATQQADLQEFFDEAPAPHVLLPWVYDLDVSGGIPIRDRQGIGPYLSGEALDGWDALAGKELDRLFRDMEDFVTFARKMRGISHWIIDVSDGTDTSTERGMEILEDRALAAERERTRMSRRRRRAAARIRSEGRWGGGVIPFGYAVAEDAHGKRLVPHPEHGAIVAKIFDDYLAGASHTAISDWLNAQGYLPTFELARELNPRMTPHGTAWKPQGVRSILVNIGHTGVLTHHGQVVRGADGMAVMRSEPLVEQVTWERAQEALKARRGRSRGPRPSRLLLGVAYCLDDGQPLYGKANGHNEYYACKNKTPARGHAPLCMSQVIRSDWLDDFAVAIFLVEVGDVDIEERVDDASGGHAIELARTGDAIAGLTADRYVRGIVHENYDQILARLQARHAELSSQPARPRSAGWRSTGQSYRQMWDSLPADTARRRALMVGAGFRIYVSQTGDQKKTRHQVDPDLSRRAGLVASGRPFAVPPAPPLPPPQPDLLASVQHILEIVEPRTELERKIAALPRDED
jgi:site-specific DNA recombinase